MKSIIHLPMTSILKEFLSHESLLPTEGKPAVSGDLTVELNRDGRSVCIEAGVTDIWLLGVSYGAFKA